METTSGGIVYNVINILMFTYATTVALSYLFLAALSTWEMQKYIHKNHFVDYAYILSSPFAPGISLIAPAYNEGLTIIDNIKSLLSIMYNNFEVIVINDGSKDDTLEKMITAFNLVRVEYDEARKELQTVLKKNTTHPDAIDVLIDVELWSDHYEDALHIAKKGLITYPNNENFLYKQASALTSLDRDKEALLCLNKLLQINPAHKKAIALYNNINLHNLKYTAAIAYGTDFFNRIFDPAHYASVQLSRTNSWGSSHVRFNYAQRFNAYGSQFEVDLYPKVANGIYAYVSYGYSESVLFPENRIGTELFFKLPKNLETSAGIRYMDFDHDTKILIYTGSVGWYFKNYWLSIRPYVTPDPETGTSASATIFLRRYFKDAENYAGLNAGLGFSPDLRRFQNGTGLSENEIYLLNSQRIGLAWQKVFHTTWTINLTADVAMQELAFNQSKYVIITSSLATIRKKI